MTAAATLTAHPAFAKDGGSGGGYGGSGSGSGGSGHDGGGSGGSGGSSGGNSGNGSSGGSGNSGHGGSSGDDGGHGSESESTGRSGDKGERGESGSGRRGSSDGRRDNDRRSDVVWSDRTGSALELRYADGWSEAVRDSRYTLRDSSRRVVVDRPARRSDRARLEAALP